MDSSLQCQKVQLASKGYPGRDKEGGLQSDVHGKSSASDDVIDGVVYAVRRKKTSINDEDHRESLENPYYQKKDMINNSRQNNLSLVNEVKDEWNLNQRRNSVDNNGIDIIMQIKPYSNLSAKPQQNPEPVSFSKSSQHKSYGTLDSPDPARRTKLEDVTTMTQVHSNMPVIITAANTNKPIKLKHRKNTMPKKKEKPKISLSGKLNRSNTKNQNVVNNDNNTLMVAQEAKGKDTLQLTHSTTDIGKSLEDRLKSFARMDVEFYDIINKMDEANERRNSLPKNDHFQQIDNTKLLSNDHNSVNLYEPEKEKCIINIQNVDDAIDEHVPKDLESVRLDNPSGKVINVDSVCFQTKDDTVVVGLLEEESNTANLSEVVKVTTEIVPDVKVTECTLDNSDTAFIKKNIGLHMHSNTPLQNDEMIVSGSSLKEKNRQSYKNDFIDSVMDDEISYDISDSNSCSQSISSLLKELPVSEALEMKEALRIMQLQVYISNEDIIHISGSKIPLAKKTSESTSPDKGEFLNVHATPVVNTIHQFCTSYQRDELELQSKIISRYSHAPSQYEVMKPRGIKELGISRFEVSDTLSNGSNTDLLSQLNFKDTTENVQKPINEGEKRLSEFVIKMMKDIECDGDDVGDKKIAKLQYVMDEIIEPDDSFNSGIVGHKLEMKDDESRYFNTLCPPKFNITPQVVTNTLAPKYVSVLESDNNVLEEDIQEEIDGGIEESVVYETMPADERSYRERIVNRKHNSAIDLINDELENESNMHVPGDRFVSVLEMRRSKKIRPESAFSFSDVQDNKPEFERSMSQPNLIVRKHVENPLLSDYNSTMDETIGQCAQLKSMKTDPQFLDGSFSERGRTGDGELRENMLRKEEILYRNVQMLERSKSMEEIGCYADHSGEMIHESHSEGNLLALSEEIMERHKSVNVGINEWLKEEFWYKWFDELFPPNDYEEVSVSRESFDSSYVSDGLTHRIEALPKNDLYNYDLIQNEIDLLSKKIDKMSSSRSFGLLGFHLCRRGACYRKLGELKNALDDLNRAIELEPKLSDAYWHRHLVFLIQENTRKALEDLQRITMYNPGHTGAHRSRAEIYRQKGETNLAIFSYNQAITSDPKNAELYYARAEVLEQRGELLLAVDDYRSADLYQPENTLAIKKIGMYHFDHRLWMIAVNDFTELLAKQPKNADAYMYRGRAWSNLGKFADAIKDMSVSITLEPNYFLPFYYRGCYLRKCMPKQALQDLSVSLLLDSTVANVNAFLHRGILYMEMKRFDQATCDFQQAVRLNPRIAAAHVNLGVIEMKHNHNIHLAVKRFNVALRMDPTYIRAVICRAEASEKVNNINGAILDYTRAIHMKPDSIDLRMTRGRLLLKKNQLDLASFHIRQCAVMNDGKNASSTQKAAVETFLKNYDNAINTLEMAVKSQPIVHLFGLLGRTRMKAKQFRNAINDFNRALKLLKPWDSRSSWPKESAEIFFLIGVCYMELNEHKSALDSFNISLKTNPTFAEGYFRRGLVRMKLGISKGVHDFNKALAYHPGFYQAYLGRAAYYGMNKRYAKAIMNCNEAIKIEKESIRAYLYRGAIKFNIKNYTLAIKDLSKAIEMDCTCSLAYFNRAVCFHEKKYYFHALKDYSIVLMTDSKLGMKALLNRGLLYFQIGDMANAVHDFVLALEAVPDNPKLHHTLGLCYHKLGELEKSIQSYTNALKVDPFFSNALLARGNVLMDYNQKLGNLLGKRDYIRALHMNPLCMEARVNLAYCLQMEGYFKKAWDLLTRTIGINPEYKAAFEGRALVNLQMSNTFGAFVDMNNAIRFSKTAESLTLRGVVNQFLGDRMNAMNDYQAAKSIEPTYSLAYYNAANLYFLHRQLSQAIAFYSKSIDWNPNDGAAILNRAVAKCISKDYDGALEDFTLVEKLCPHWSHIYFNRGYLYYLNEKYELAEDEYTKALVLQPDDALLYKKRADSRGKCGKNELALKDYRRSIYLQMAKNLKNK